MYLQREVFEKKLLFGIKYQILRDEACKYDALSRTKEQECIFVNPCFRHLEFMEAMIDWARAG